MKQGKADGDLNGVTFSQKARGTNEKSRSSARSGRKPKPQSSSKGKVARLPGGSSRCASSSKEGPLKGATSSGTPCCPHWSSGKPTNSSQCAYHDVGIANHSSPVENKGRGNVSASKILQLYTRIIARARERKRYGARNVAVGC